MGWLNRLLNRGRDKSLPDSVVMCYHSISDEVNPDLHSVTSDHFEKQIRGLLSDGYTFVSIDELLGTKVNRKIASVTFDDGYVNVSEALPTLSALSIPFTVFVSTCAMRGELFWRDLVRTIISNNHVNDFRSYLETSEDSKLASEIDWSNFYWSTKFNHVNSKALNRVIKQYFLKRNLTLSDHKLYLTREIMESFPKNLFTVGNHTRNHYRMSTLTVEEQEEEISGGREDLELLNLPTSHTFAIPFGENGSFNQDTIKLLKDHGYSGFCMTNPSQAGSERPQIEVNPLDLNFCNRILPKDGERII